MTDTVVTPVEAPAAAPAAAPVAAPPPSLIHPAPGAAPAAPPAAPGAPEFAFADKVLAKAADGATDWETTARNAETARQHLEKRLGAGDVPPKSAAEYTFTMPDELKEFQLKDERMTGFREAAHAQGLTQKQYEFVMSQYLASVPDLMEGAAAMTAEQARGELGKVWTSPAAMQQNLSNATRALQGLPADLQEATREFGTNPAFLRAMAHFGAQMREDVPPSGMAPSAPVGDVNSLMAHPAYKDQRHPDHARVSAQVADFYRRTGGNAPL